MGAIGWQQSTRPDLAHTHSKLARFTANPGPEHFKALKQVLAYIKGTIDYCLIYDGARNNLHAYSDTDFAGDIDTARSTGGYIIKKGNCVIGWRSRLQGNVTLSTTEAEYVGLSDTARELMWFRCLENAHDPSTLYCSDERIILYGDNQASLKLATKPEYHKRTRHIRVYHHYVRELIQQGQLRVEYVRTDDMVADILTLRQPHGSSHLRCM